MIVASRGFIYGGKQKDETQRPATNRSSSSRGSERKDVRPSSASSSGERTDEQVMAEVFQQLEVLCEPRTAPAMREQVLLNVFGTLRHYCSYKTQLEALEIIASLLERKPDVMADCRNALPLVLNFLHSLSHSTRQLALNAQSSSSSMAATLLSTTSLNTTASARALATALPEELRTAMQCRLLWIVGLIGRHNITVHQLHRLCRVLQAVVEGRARPLLSPLLITSLLDMATPPLPAAGPTPSGASILAATSSVAPWLYTPSSSFEFSGISASLAVPRFEKWPGAKGYSIGLWVKWEPDAPTGSAVTPNGHSTPSSSGSHTSSSGASASGALQVLPFRTIYSFLTGPGRGIELCVSKKTGQLILRSTSKSGPQQVPTTAQLSSRHWTFVTITHTRPKMFSTSSGKAAIWLNDTLKAEVELTYPSLTDAFNFNAIGSSGTEVSLSSASTNSAVATTSGASQAAMASQSTFYGRMGSMYLFNKPLTPAQTHMLYRGGSDYCIDIVARGERGGLVQRTPSGISSIFSGVFATAETKESDSARDMFRGLVFLYHPKCTADGSHPSQVTGIPIPPMAIDATPMEGRDKGLVPLHAVISSGVRISRSHSIRDVIFSATGGIAILFPLFHHLDLLCPPSDTPSLRSSSSLLPLVLRCLNQMLKHSPDNLTDMLRWEGIAIVATLLNRAAPHHLTEQAVEAIAELLCHSSWLGAMDWIDQRMRHRDDVRLAHTFVAVNTDIPIQRATERTLFNDVFYHLVLNFGLWHKQGVSQSVATEVVTLVKSYVNRQPKYFAQLLNPQTILDALQQHISYRDTGLGALSATRALRREWWSVIKSLIMVDASPSHGHIDSRAITMLLSAACQGINPDEVAPKLPTGDADEDDDAEEAAIAGSLHVAEILEFINELMMGAPDVVYSHIVTAGGAPLLLNILNRFPTHQHIQLAVVHLLAAMLKLGTAPGIKPALRLKTHAMFSSLQDLMAPHPLTAPTYRALMEAMIGLQPGEIGAANAVDFFISQQDEPLELMAPVPPQWLVQAPGSGRGSGKTPVSGGGMSHSNSGSNGSGSIPMVVNTPMSMNRRKASDLEEQQGHPLPASMLQRELRFPKGLEVVLALSARTATGVTRRGVLGDLATLLRAQHNCATIVAALPCWPKPFIDLIDWKQGEPVSTNGIHLGIAEAQLEEELTEIPVAVLPEDMLTHHHDDKPNKRAMLSIDDFIEHSSTPVRGSGSGRHAFAASPSISSPPGRATMPGLTTSVSPLPASASVASASSMMMTHSEPLLQVSPAAMRLIQTLLHHAVVFMKEGWKQVRHAFVLLRFAADYQEVPEHEFRSIRRQLLCGLFHLLSQTPSNLLTLQQVTLRINVCQVIDFVEELCYVDMGRRGLEVSMVSANTVMGDISGMGSSGRDLHNGTPVKANRSSSSGGNGALSPRASPALDREHSNDWVLFDEVKDDIHAAELTQSTGIVGGFERMRQEWRLVEEMVRCVIDVLRLPLRPATKHAPGSNPTGPLPSDTPLGLDSIDPGVRPGSPLRVVLRLLLDCVDSFCDTHDAHEPDPHTLANVARVLERLHTIVTNELGIGAPIPGKKPVPIQHRQWKNRFGLFVLQRLCSITYKCHPSTSAVIMKTLQDLVGILQPFAIVTGSSFLDATMEPIPKAATEQFIFKLGVDRHAQITVSSDLAAFSNLLASAFPSAAGSASSPSTQTTPPRGAALLSRGATSPNPQPSSLARSSSSSVLRSPTSPMSPNGSGAATDDLTALSERVHNACVDDVVSTIRMMHSIEKKIATEAYQQNETTEVTLRGVLKTEIELMATRAADWLRQSLVICHGYHLGEVARRSRVDLFRAEQSHGVHKQWRRLSSQLFHHDGSPWSPAQLAGGSDGQQSQTLITSWKVDEVEDGLRMRRKLRPWQANDHNHSTAILLAAREQAALQQARLARPISSSSLLSSPSTTSSSSLSSSSIPSASTSSAPSSTVPLPLPSPKSATATAPSSSPTAAAAAAAASSASISSSSSSSQLSSVAASEPISIPVTSSTSPAAAVTTTTPSIPIDVASSATISSSLSSASSSTSAVSSPSMTPSSPAAGAATVPAIVEASSPPSPSSPSMGSPSSTNHNNNSVEAVYSVPITAENKDIHASLAATDGAISVTTTPAVSSSTASTESTSMGVTSTTLSRASSASSSSAPSSTASSPQLQPQQPPSPAVVAAIGSPPSGGDDDHSVTESDSDDTDDAEQDKEDQKRFAQLSRGLGRSMMVAGGRGESKDDDDDIAADEAKASEAKTPVPTPSPATTTPTVSSSSATPMSPVRDSNGENKKPLSVDVNGGNGMDDSKRVMEQKDQIDVEAAAAAANAAALAAAAAVLKEGTVHSSICIMVTSIMQLEGRLEIGATHIHFIPARPSSSAASSDNNLASPSAWPSTKKPYTLPSLDAIRHRAQSEEKKWPLPSIQAVYRRRYQLQRTALEFFMMNGKNYFFDFGDRDERNKVLRMVMKMRPPNLIGLCSRPPTELLKHSNLTDKWQKRQISNFEYLMHLNTISGRTYNDLNQYPVFPWVMQYFEHGRSGEEIDVQEVIAAGPTHRHAERVFRDLSKPIGALWPSRLEQVLARFKSFADTDVPPFHYGSHYSNAATVLFYLLRLEPFASLHIELQAGKFDYSDRLFTSVAQTWKNCMTSLSCFKELTPEFYYLPEMFENINGYELGRKQDGQLADDVRLPPWASSAEEFVRISRKALESEYVSQNLHHWIDLIFGYKQRGQAALDAHNLFFHLTYEGAVDLSTIKDPVLLEAAREQIAQFGQTPLQLFNKPHPSRTPLPPSKLAMLSLRASQLDAFQQEDFAHPIMLQADVTPGQPVLHIGVFKNKIQTISSKFTLASHIWYPTRAARNPFIVDPSLQPSPSSVAAVVSSPSGVVSPTMRRPPNHQPTAPPHMYPAIGPNPQSPLAPMPSFDERAALTASSSSRTSRVGSGSGPSSSGGDYDDDKRRGSSGYNEQLPFTYDIAMIAPFPQATPPLPAALAFSPCGRLLLAGNSWDDALATFATSFSLNLDALARAPSANQRHRRGSCGDIKCTSLQQLVHHKARVTCVAMGKDGTTVVTGSRDCTLRVWDVVTDDAAKATSAYGGRIHINSTPRHILRGHEDEIISVAVDTELDLCISVSSRGVCLLHTLRRGRLLRRLIVTDRANRKPNSNDADSKDTAPVSLSAADEERQARDRRRARARERRVQLEKDAAREAEIKREVEARAKAAAAAANGKVTDTTSATSGSDGPLTRFAQFSGDGHIILYAHSRDTSNQVITPRLSVCNINGRHWRSVPLADQILCMSVTIDGALVVTGSIHGEVLLRRVFDLRVVQRFEAAGSAVTSISFSPEQAYIFVGTAAGQFLIYPLRKSIER